MSERADFGKIKLSHRVKLIIGLWIALAAFKAPYLFSKIRAKHAHYESETKMENERILQDGEDEGEFIVVWDIDLGGKDFLLESNYLKAGLELSVKEFINNDLKCEEENSGIESAAFFSLEIENENLNKRKKLSGNGKCKGTRKKCKKRIKKTVSDVARDDFCQNFLGTTIFDAFNDTLVTASSFNYNINVEFVNDFSGLLALNYDVTFVESDGDGLAEITEVDFEPGEPEKITITCDERCEEQRRDQRSTMLEIYNHFDLPFDEDKHECLFEGINCNMEDLVTHIWLENYDLSGKTIPEAFLQLPFLVGLFLGGNQLVGTIPTRFGIDLFKLQMLWLQDNALTGPIPTQLGNYNGLKEMNLHGNRLTGTIPSELGKLKRARFLNLSKNNLNGTIPSEFGGSIEGNDPVPPECRFFRKQAMKLGVTWLLDFMPSSAMPLERLEVLSLHENNLSGSIPATLSNLNQLIEFSLADNKLTGNLPSGLGNMTELVVLDFHNNHISGLILDEIGKLKKLEVLNLYNNRLEKSIPTTIGLLSQLKEVILDENELTGSLPTYIGNLRKLKFLAFSGNKMSGQIPSEIGKLVSLNNLDIRDYKVVGERNGKRIGGTIPTELGNLRSWKYPIFIDNGISGTIPSEFGRLLSAEFLWLRNQDLSGSIPDTFANLKTISLLSLGNNSIDGTIPSTLGILKGLEALDVGDNNLGGTIPTDVGQLSSLEYFNAEKNELTGSIPSEFGNLEALRGLDLEENQLNGTIPTELGLLESIEFIDFSANDLSGTVPSELLNLTGLVLNTSGNNLKIVAFDGEDGDEFGYSIAASDEFIAVGAFGDNSTYGAVYVYSSTGEFVRKIAAPADVRSFGSSVALCGDTLVVGGTSTYIGNDAYSGGAYLFDIDGTLRKNLADTYGSTVDHSVACSEDAIVVGKTQGTFPETDILDTNGTFKFSVREPNIEGSTEDFAFTVAVSEGKVAIGNPGMDDDSGVVHIFTTNGTYERTLQAPERASTDRFGEVLAMSDSLVVIGAPNANEGRGKAFMFSITTGLYIDSLVAPDPSAKSFFSQSLAISNETILVGAPDDNRIGAVYTFLTNGTFVNKFAAPDPGLNERFGNDIAILGEAGLISSPGFNQNMGSLYIFPKLPTSSFITNTTLAPTLAPTMTFIPSSAPSTTFAPSSCCPSGKFPFKLEVLTDVYPGETSWQILKDDNITVVGENPASLVSTTLYVEDYCLDDGCYIFTIEDTYGDGITYCFSDCTEGYFMGYLYGRGSPIFGGGEFSFSDSRAFCGVGQCSAPTQSPMLASSKPSIAF